jgi:hypothetical protein
MIYLHVYRPNIVFKQVNHQGVMRALAREKVIAKHNLHEQPGDAGYWQSRPDEERISDPFPMGRIIHHPVLREFFSKPFDNPGLFRTEGFGCRPIGSFDLIDQELIGIHSQRKRICAGEYSPMLS